MAPTNSPSINLAMKQTVSVLVAICQTAFASGEAKDLNPIPDGGQLHELLGYSAYGARELKKLRIQLVQGEESEISRYSETLAQLELLSDKEQEGVRAANNSARLKWQERRQEIIEEIERTGASLTHLDPSLKWSSRILLSQEGLLHVGQDEIAHEASMASGKVQFRMSKGIRNARLTIDWSEDIAVDSSQNSKELKGGGRVYAETENSCVAVFGQFAIVVEGHLGDGAVGMLQQTLNLDRLAGLKVEPSEKVPLFAALSLKSHDKPVIDRPAVRKEALTRLRSLLLSAEMGMNVLVDLEKKRLREEARVAGELDSLESRKLALSLAKGTGSKAAAEDLLGVDDEIQQIRQAHQFFLDGIAAKVGALSAETAKLDGEMKSLAVGTLLLASGANNPDHATVESDLCNGFVRIALGQVAEPTCAVSLKLMERSDIVEREPEIVVGSGVLLQKSARGCVVAFPKFQLNFWAAEGVASDADELLSLMKITIDLLSISDLSIEQ